MPELTFTQAVEKAGHGAALAILLHDPSSAVKHIVELEAERDDWKRMHDLRVEQLGSLEAQLTEETLDHEDTMKRAQAAWGCAEELRSVVLELIDAINENGDDDRYVSPVAGAHVVVQRSIRRAATAKEDV